MRSARAASFTGKVTLPDGKPAFGAMVTVFNADKTTRQTVYTAADGSYAIRTPYAGKLDVRARLANYDDQTVSVESTADTGPTRSGTEGLRVEGLRLGRAVGLGPQREARLVVRVGPGGFRQPVQLLPPDRERHDADAAQP